MTRDGSIIRDHITMTRGGKHYYFVFLYSHIQQDVSHREEGKRWMGGRKIGDFVFLSACRQTKDWHWVTNVALFKFRLLPWTWTTTSKGDLAGSLQSVWMMTKSLAGWCTNIMHKLQHKSWKMINHVSKDHPSFQTKRNWKRGYEEVTEIVCINNQLTTNKRLTFLTSMLRDSPADTFITPPCSTLAQCPQVLSRNKHHPNTWRTTERMAETIAAAPLSCPPSSSGLFFL